MIHKLLQLKYWKVRIYYIKLYVKSIKPQTPSPGYLTIDLNCHHLND